MLSFRLRERDLQGGAVRRLNYKFPKGLRTILERQLPNTTKDRQEGSLGQVGRTAHEVEMHRSRITPTRAAAPGCVGF